MPYTYIDQLLIALENSETIEFKKVRQYQLFF
jgi:hypothetical protein